MIGREKKKEIKKKEKGWRKEGRPAGKMEEENWWRKKTNKQKDRVNPAKYINNITRMQPNSITINPLTPSVWYIGHQSTKEPVREQRKTIEKENSGVKGLSFSQSQNAIHHSRLAQLPGHSTHFHSQWQHMGRAWAGTGPPKNLACPAKNNWRFCYFAKFSPPLMSSDSKISVCLQESFCSM